MITLVALYVALRGRGLALHEYRHFMRADWYHSLSRSGAVAKHTEERTMHYIRATPAQFMNWAQTSGFWSEDEINEVAGLILCDMLKDE